MAETEPAPLVPAMPSLVLGLGTPVDLTVVALYTFHAATQGQLPFGKGDIIRVTENQVSLAGSAFLWDKSIEYSIIGLY